MGLEVVDKNLYKEIRWDAFHRLLEFHWTEHVQTLSLEDYIRESKDFLKYETNYRPQNILVSFVELRAPLAAEVQAWYLTEITSNRSKLVTKINKVAFVVNENLHLQDSLESMIDYAKPIYKKIAPYRFFTDIESARYWITS